MHSLTTPLRASCSTIPHERVGSVTGICKCLMQQQKKIDPEILHASTTLEALRQEPPGHERVGELLPSLRQQATHILMTVLYRVDNTAHPRLNGLCRTHTHICSSS